MAPKSRPVPPEVQALIEADEPHTLYPAMITLFLASPSQKGYHGVIPNSTVKDVATPSGERKPACFNALYRDLAEAKGFAPEDQDPVRISRQLEDDKVIWARWKDGKNGRRFLLIGLRDPNFKPAVGSSVQASTAKDYGF